MTNLTISLDESIIRSARVRAIQEGTSVSAKVREFLAQYAQYADSAAGHAQRRATNSTQKTPATVTPLRPKQRDSSKRL